MRKGSDVTCFCGNDIAISLSRLGSLWCHDCRDDPDRRHRLIAQAAQPARVITIRAHRWAPRLRLRRAA